MMRVYFVGLRAFPGVQGGIESHVENLVAQISKVEKINIVCFGRKRFMRKPNSTPTFRWIWLWAPNKQGLETFIHTMLCVVNLAFMRRGVVHLHGIGPGAFSPVLRLLGYRVVVTHHGYDYARAKWGPFASLILRAGEYFAVAFAHAVISVSSSVTTELAARFNRPIHYVPNGMPNRDAHVHIEAIHTTQTCRPFILMASRFVPEKRIQDAIEAFNLLGSDRAELVIAGSQDGHQAGYDASLRNSVSPDKNVVFIGNVSHEVLWSLMRNCLAFVNASSHEGLPISVLEAGAQGARLILSDIPAHREFGLPNGAYYPVGNVEELSGRMSWVLQSHEEADHWHISQEKMLEYSWEKITDSVARIYEDSYK